MPEIKSEMQTNAKSHTLLFPIIPLSLTAKKPKHSKYPKKILTVGDEVRKMRMDRGLTQQQVAKQLSVNKNFIYELELNKRKPSIYTLHKVHLFLGYIPKVLKINNATLQEKLFVYRIKNNLTYIKLAKQIGLDKSTLARFENAKIVKQETYERISNYINKNDVVL